MRLAGSPSGGVLGGQGGGGTVTATYSHLAGVAVLASGRAL